jgi:hypothetical protein
VSQITVPSRIKSCTSIQKIKEIKPHTALAAISIILLLSAAIVTPSISAFAEKDHGKGHNSGKNNNHHKDRKDKDNDNDNDKKCKPKKNGKYHKDCD